MRVVVLGGYGLFGSRVCRLLARIPDCEVVVAGRDLAKAQTLANELSVQNSGISAAAIDLHAPDFAARLPALAGQILLHCAGPFQGQDYTVAKAALAAGMHYIDLADGREFVSQITSLDAMAKAKNCLVYAGASSVPALSSAVLQQYQAQFEQVLEIDMGISPGNHTERTAATVRSILSYVGHRIPAWQDGQASTRTGWLGLTLMRYPGVGKRWLSDCDVPDLVLLPERYPQLHSLRFRAGVELSVLHLGLYALACLRRFRLLPNLSKFAELMRKMSNVLRPFGTDQGAMHVRITGLDHQHRPLCLTWFLQAHRGHGPYVPAAASVALVRAIMDGRLRHAGAQAAVAALPLQYYLDELQHLDIVTELCTAT